MFGRNFDNEIRYKYLYCELVLTPPGPGRGLLSNMHIIIELLVKLRNSAND